MVAQIITSAYPRNRVAAITRAAQSAGVNLPGGGDTKESGRCERIEMTNFDADDVKVYKGWLRRTLAVYAGMLLLGAATIAAFALTSGPNSARILATALSLTAP